MNALVSSATWVRGLIRFLPVLVLGLLVGAGLIWFTLGAPIASAQAVVPPPSPGHQALCVGVHCNGTNPYTTQCAGSGATALQLDEAPLVYKQITLANISLWFSATCNTMWTQCAGKACPEMALYLMQCIVIGGELDGSESVQQSPPFYEDQPPLTGQQYVSTHLFQAAADYAILGPEGTGMTGTSTGCF